MSRYVIGIDFGTLSGRCVLVDASDGRIVAESTCDYAHGVMDVRLPCGAPLPPQYALQHPLDYIEVLRTAVPAVLKQAGVGAEEVGGLGIDFTASTLLAVDEKGMPLCLKAEYEEDPHAFVKLWKHHGAQKQADAIGALASKRGESWLANYGGKISCEWALPKIFETLCQSPSVYEAAHRFTEAADWLSFVLTGVETHSAAFAGYKWLWQEETGFPSDDFLTELDPRLSGLVGGKVAQKVSKAGEIAGRLHAEGAALTGLCRGTPVALPMIDAHAAMPALNITGDGELMLILGTSACHILNATEKKAVEGICGFVKDSVIPGMYTYEAGQSAVGDIFDWFVKGFVPFSYAEEARRREISLHRLLREKASSLAVGESGLLALDWWNGNRSVLNDARLFGMILGMHLQTKPEEIYRALLEATAFGLRVIVEQYASAGLTVRSVCAAGGIAVKDSLMMQIYADVLNCEIRVSPSTQSAALGSAIYAAVAAGAYADVTQAASHMGRRAEKTYCPVARNAEAYERLYREYRALHEYFGKENAVMKRLHAE